MCEGCDYSTCKCENPKPHKYAALIKAWADGAKIQVNNRAGWQDVSTPRWDLYCEYRIKPEPKPDEVVYATVTRSGIYNAFITSCSSHNVKFTFDGETGKLKSTALCN